MLLNISYNDRDIQQKVNESVGRSFSIIQRIKMKGAGSPKMRVQEASEEIQELLDFDNNINTCSIELRPKGVIIHFRSILETYGVVIPYYKLTIYKTDAKHYTIYSGEHRIRVTMHKAPICPFFRQLLVYKTQHGSQYAFVDQ